MILAVDSDGAPYEAFINRIHQRCILANLKKARPYVLAMSAGSAEFDPDQPTPWRNWSPRQIGQCNGEKQKRQKRPSAKGPVKQQAELDLAYGSDKIAS